jgi:hypothetical protein
MAPIPVPETIRGFFDLEFGPDSAGFFRTLFSVRAVAVYFAEALLFSPLLVLPYLAARLTGGSAHDVDRSGDETGTAAPRRSDPSRGRRPEPAAADASA